MVYRELDDVAQKRLAARAELDRLAVIGMVCWQQADRPKTAPLRGAGDQWMRKLRFTVVEDAETALAATPKTRDAQIWVQVEPMSLDDVELVRRAVWSLHPLFDTSLKNSKLWIELPSSKVLDVRDWIRSVIERVLSPLHRFHHITGVSFGRDPPVRTGGCCTCQTS